MKFVAPLALIAIAFTQSPPAQAVPLTFSYLDPIGDQTGSVDVVGLTFDFDDSTGAYEIRLTADSANPFLGAFRVNINLFNADAGTTAADPSLFSDTFNDFNLGSATTALTLTGTNTRLIAWDVGDRVAITGPAPLGVPDGSTSFQSAVRNLPDVELEDFIAYGEFTVVRRAVPEPGMLALFGLGLAGLGVSRRRTR